MNPDNIFRVTCLWLALSVPSASAATFPAYFTPPPKAVVIEETLVDEDFGEASFAIDSDERNLEQGRHYHADLRLPGVDDSTHEALWPPLEPP